MDLLLLLHNWLLLLHHLGLLLHLLDVDGYLLDDYLWLLLLLLHIDDLLLLYLLLLSRDVSNIFLDVGVNHIAVSATVVTVREILPLGRELVLEQDILLRVSIRTHGHEVLLLLLLSLEADLVAPVELRVLLVVAADELLAIAHHLLLVMEL